MTKDGKGLRARRLMPFVWLFSILALVYVPMFLGQIIFFRDPAHWNYPARWFLHASWARGDSPAWNPDHGLGFAVYGNPLYGLYYPPNWLYLLGTSGTVARMLTWQSFAHTFWGGAGIAVLAWRLGCGVTGSVVASLAWALSGFTTSMWTAGLLLVAGAWVPWCAVGFLGLVNSMRKGRSSWLVGIVKSAIPVAMSLLMGEVFVAMMGVGFGIATAMAVNHAERRASPTLPRLGRRYFAALAAALVLAAGVGAIAVLPARAIAVATDRSAPLARDAAEMFSLHPFRLLELVAPQAMGDPYERYPAGKWVGEAALGQVPLSYSVYLGASVLVLVMVAFQRGRRLSRLLGVLALIALAVSLGKHLPIHQALRTLVRPLGYMRYPEKYLVMVVGWVALLAGLGARRLLWDAGRPWRRMGIFVVLLLVLAAGARAWLPAEFGGYVRTGALRAAVAAIGVLAVAFLAGRRPRAASMLLIGCVAVDLGRAVWPLQGFGPSRIATDVPPAAAAILHDHNGGSAHPRLYRADQVDPSVQRFVHVASNSEGELRSTQTLVINTVATFGIAAFPGYDAAIPSALSQLFTAGQKTGQNVLRLLGVGYAMLPVEDPRDPGDRRVGFEAMMDPLPGARLYRVKNPLPRVFMAGRADVLSGDETLKSLFDAGVLDGKRVLLAPGAAPSRAAVGGAPGRAGTCDLISFANTRVHARCRADRAGVVVFVEQYDAGWRAEVDGTAAPLHRANLLMRGVVVGPGEHDVVLIYTPPQIGVAGAMALASLFLLAGLLAAYVFLRRRPGVAGVIARGAD